MVDADDDQVWWEGALALVVALTVVDVARSGGLGAGLETADAALREGSTARVVELAAQRR